MRDKKFIIALLIIVALVLVLLFITVVNPQVQGYVVAKQAQAQENVVNSILKIVDQQGYVAIGDGENSIVLVRYQPPQQGESVAEGESTGEEPALEIEELSG